MYYRWLLGFVSGIVLLVLSACAGVTNTPTGSPATGTMASAQVVHVTLTDRQITADRSTFSVGTPYHFVVQNQGQVAHQFLFAPIGDWDYDHMSMEERHHKALYMDDQVAPGETKTFEYTFPASAVGQHYGFGCYGPGHDDAAGWWYPLTVQPHP